MPESTVEDILKKWIHPVGTPLGLVLGTIVTILIAIPVLFVVNFAKAVRLTDEVTKRTMGGGGRR